MNGRPVNMPQVIEFEDVGLCFWRYDGKKRPPKEGEFYLYSGEIVSAFLASIDLRTPHCWSTEPVRPFIANPG